MRSFIFLVVVVFALAAGASFLKPAAGADPGYTGPFAADAVLSAENAVDNGLVSDGSVMSDWAGNLQKLFFIRAMAEDDELQQKLNQSALILGTRVQFFQVETKNFPALTKQMEKSLAKQHMSRNTILAALSPIFKVDGQVFVKEGYNPNLEELVPVLAHECGHDSRDFFRRAKIDVLYGENKLDGQMAVTLRRRQELRADMLAMDMLSAAERRGAVLLNGTRIRPELLSRALATLGRQGLMSADEVALRSSAADLYLHRRKEVADARD